MPSKKTVLIVEDNAVNRAILTKILSKDYDILEAINGQEGLSILQQNRDTISAVILDLIMPVMDGYAFLEHTSRDSAYSDLPIIVSTGNTGKENEKQALRLGAWDFISKPYDSEILQFRLKNAIERSQLSAFNQLKYVAEYDTLTDIYNKSKFFAMTHTMLCNYPQEAFVFVRVDIDRFQLVNAFYGMAEGDRLLRYLADKLRQRISQYELGTYGRMEADIFALCIPYLGEEALLQVIEQCKQDLKAFDLNFKLTPTCGIYVIQDNQEEVNRMLDKANLAAKRVKGSYMRNYAFYEEEMSRAIEEEQEITNEMVDALNNEEFQVYLQPKYNLSTNKPEGAEALVRWQHPVKGMISPGRFIPVFERNGFIAQLDYYMWEHVCMLLQRWIAAGEQPFPISVNVSRVNIYTSNLIERITGLTQKYGIPNELLYLELTESAYTENPQVMMDIIEKLQAEGFVILMDDFGSGYSSLNILKDIEVDILKLDMKFLSDTKTPGRSKNIISSVVRMAKWLHMPVIAEGVEKEEQVEFLRGIGCEYVQGYYFAKPMPVSEYEHLAKSEAVFQLRGKQPMDTDALWVSDSQLDPLFSNVLQPVAIYEFADEHLEILRVNNAFHELFGYEDISRNSVNPLELVQPSSRAFILDAFHAVVDTRSTAECEYQRVWKAGKTMWVQLKLKYIDEIAGKHIVLGSFADITAQKKIDLELQKYRALVGSHRSNSGKMLIVDDLEMNREILRLIFQDRFIILEAENGEQALQVLEQNSNNVDIILLDLMMPVMNGIEFLKVKRGREEFSDIPVIIITADGTAEQQINTLALGANDYIVKPFVEEVVVRRVTNVLESNRRFREILREYDALAQKAQMDPLTGLYNRVITEQLISHVLTERPNDTHALIMVDIDNFKTINDLYGHVSGDEAIICLSQKLGNFFRKGDIIGRLGGDEFCVFMMSVPSEDLVMEKCAQLCMSMQKNPLTPLPVKLTVSMGAALSNQQTTDFVTLYQNADLALYEAKRQGKNQVAIYGKTAMSAVVCQWLNKEWLMDALDVAIVVVDDTTLEVLYCNNMARRMLNIDEYQGKPCYEVLHKQKEPCSFCIREKLSFDSCFQWKDMYRRHGLQVIARDKLLDLNGHRIHLQMLVEVSSMQTVQDIEKEGEHDES